VAVTVDMPFVPFRYAEEALQVKVVAREFWIVATGKQAGRKRLHGSGHRLVDRIAAALQLCGESFKSGLALSQWAGGGFQRGGYLTHRLEVWLQLRLRRCNLVETPLQGGVKAAQLLFSCAPFFASKLR
jgi:hypothetical protein